MDNQLTLISTAIAASVLAGQEILKIYKTVFQLILEPTTKKSNLLTHRIITKHISSIARFIEFNQNTELLD